MQELLFQERGINWNDYPAGARRGRAVIPQETERDVEYVDKRTGETKLAQGVKRRSWTVVDPPVFSRDRAWVQSLLPSRAD